MRDRETAGDTEKGLFSKQGRIKRSTFWVRYALAQVAMLLLVGRGGEPLETLVEYLGAIFIVNLVAMFADGTPGPNRYGDDPKGRPSVS